MARQVIGKVTKVWNLKLHEAMIKDGKATQVIDDASSLRSIFSKPDALVWIKNRMTKVEMHRTATKNSK